MKNYTIVTKRTYQPSPGRIVSSLSQTVPDQSMTLRELLNRHAKGLPLMGNNQNPYYEGEEGSSLDPRNLDLSEIEDMKQNNKADIDRLKNKIEADKASKTAKKALDEERRTQEKAEKARKEAEKPD